MQRCLFLLRGERYPIVKQFLQFRGQFHHLALGEELGQGDAKGGADGLKGCNGRDRVPLEDICQCRLGKAALLG